MLADLPYSLSDVSVTSLYPQSGKTVACPSSDGAPAIADRKGAVMASPRNERKTENIVRDSLRELGYNQSDGGAVIEEQKSDLARLQKLLEHASKKGDGVGKPEFIIRSIDHQDFLIIVECKASTRHHVSDTLDKYKDFAVDGVLLYASFLSKEYDVLAVAVSGQDREHLRISHYIHLRGEDKPVEFPQARGFLPLNDYYQAFLHSEPKFRQDYHALLDFSRRLNSQLHTRKVPEADRALLISGILIALQNEAFKKSFAAHRTAKHLATSLLNTIRGEFDSAGLPPERLDDLAQAYSFIPRTPALLGDKEVFVGLIRSIDSDINGFMRTHAYYDAIGQFYVEFLRYANNEKGLGIVLTPYYIAELFADLAEVNRDSIVYDNCCGTSGLLVAAMSAMVSDAGADESLKKKIKNEHLFGIEYQPKNYALAVSNMILHGDGKANIFRGDCFKDSKKLLALRKPTVGILNPPYRNKKDKGDKQELEYVYNNLECLEQGGKCVAIVPMTCATAPSGAIAEWKRKLLQEHTLEAVMSMPAELFHNSKTSVITCVMVFTAHRPHPAGKKTWFGYWREDGLVKTKHRGRIDLHGRWQAIRDRWVMTFRNREVHAGESVMQMVAATDEWCAEAYMETDYTKIAREDFERVVRGYATFKLLGARAESSDADEEDDEQDEEAE
jgi:type I restriction enzyme M protein